MIALGTPNELVKQSAEAVHGCRFSTSKLRAEGVHIPREVPMTEDYFRDWLRDTRAMEKKALC